MPISTMVMHAAHKITGRFPGGSVVRLWLLFALLLTGIIGYPQTIHSVDSTNRVGIRHDTIVVNQPTSALNNSTHGVQKVIKPVPHQLQDEHTEMFYLLAVLFFFLGIFRLVFDRYVSNLFQVFFNTSLRQSQLTDQLLQARWPSFLLNVFFCLVIGFYLLLLMKANRCTSAYFFRGLFICAGMVVLIYVTKFLVTRLMGWVTDQAAISSEYLFILFLFNKMVALFLFPLIVIIAFADGWFYSLAMTMAVILFSLWMILRYYRAFGLFSQRLQISRFHFLLYVIGIEVLPILLLWHWGSAHLCKFL
ncbi:MAG: DUF4271 domain-containing protein [Ferruginibacter sp.]